MITELAPGEEMIDVAAAKRWLRIDGNDQDRDIEESIKEARSWLEQQSAKTCRLNVLYQATLPMWPDHQGCIADEERRLRTVPRQHRSRYFFPRPPFIDYGQTAVQYYDEAGVLRELDCERYRIINSATSVACLDFDENTCLPTLDDRDDAVQIQWSAGFSDSDSVHPGMMLCMKHILRAVYDGDIDQLTWDFLTNLVARYDHGHYA